MRASLLSGAEQSVYHTHHTKPLHNFECGVYQHCGVDLSTNPLRFCQVLMEFTKQMNKKDAHESKMYRLQWSHLHKESLNNLINHMTYPPPPQKKIDTYFLRWRGGGGTTYKMTVIISGNDYLFYSMLKVSNGILILFCIIFIAIVKAKIDILPQSLQIN